MHRRHQLAYAVLSLVHAAMAVLSVQEEAWTHAGCAAAVALTYASFILPPPCRPAVEAGSKKPSEHVETDHSTRVE